MAYSELLPKQREATEGWISSAFKRYLASDIRETTDLLPPEAVDRFIKDRRSYIQRYGDEFSRILHGDVQVCYGVDLPKLRADLHKLMIGGCPALEFVERLLDCRVLSGHDICWTEINRDYETSLFRLEQDLQQLAGQVSDLLNPDGGMPHHLRELMPKKYKEQDREPRMWQLVSSLPETLECVAAMVGSYSPAGAAEEHIYGARVSLAYFYRLLKRFRLGFPTLSRFMRVSRQVSCTISSRKDCPLCKNPIGRTRSAKRSEEQSKGRPDDPLSQEALQQSMFRFIQENPDWSSSRPASELADSADKCDLDKSAADTGGE